MVIIKYHEWLKILPYYKETVYELCSDDFKKVKRLSKEEAIKMIEENNLKRVHRNMFGAVWR